MTKLNQIAGACTASVLLAAAIPAFAQSSTTPRDTKANDARTYTTDTRKEDNNWGWLGLLGLAGLMGLKGRAHHDDKLDRTGTNRNAPGRA